MRPNSFDHARPWPARRPIPTIGGIAFSKISALLVAVLVALAMLVPTDPAAAIIDGTPDGNGHPYVAAIGPPRPAVASGVLISPTVVLTAAHVAERRLGPGAARVTFDPVADSSATWYTGTAYLHPDYNPVSLDELHDVGVIVLDSPVVGITPASLPTANFLDELGPHELNGASFTAVGYGMSRRSDDGGKPGFELASGGTRRFAPQTFASLGSEFLRVRMDSGDICGGDSGGPTLLGGTSVVAGLTAVEGSYAAKECRSHPWYQRVDTPSARAFIGQYVTLP